ncbi:MAG: ribosome maturation factor RimM [Gammaproteobacteria bacterium]|nr:ribosome maturation factor RimM [Gammaproteobacteria bacterium]MCY4227293.1 ribosome maturation factor RimM [Gammaproteobacteria bacterium]
MNNPEPADSPIVIGRIVGHHGLKGWVKVDSFTRPREQFREYQTILVGKKGTWKQVRIEEHKAHSRNLLIRLGECESREQAEPVIGADIAIEHDQLTELSEGEYYWIDLIGLSAVNLQGAELGTISRIIETGANDVIVAQSGQAEILIPWIPDVIRNVDLEERLIVVDWQQDYLS